ncbi:MAG: dihydrolipoyl dehydrogenase, partial [Sneathiella sp.]
MSDTNFDLVVIGSGPGGYVAAIRASQLGLKSAVIEREHIGGICLNWGCIPTKALLRTADIYRNIQHAAGFGIKVDGASVDLEATVKRSRQVAAQLSGGVSGLLKKNKVTVINGHGKLAGAGKVEVDDDGKKSIVSAKHIILATGARARNLPGMEPDGKFIWSYREALVPDTMPKRLLVVGSGAIGIEFASFFNALGSEVTVVEVMDRVLPVEDADISAMAEKSFKKQGMKIMKGTTVTELKKSANDVTATFKDKKDKTSTGTFDRVIMAVGIVGNVENIGLEGTKIKVDRTHIEVDDFSQTAEPGVYAIGDLTGPPWLAHKASHEGVICVEKLAGQKDVHPLVVQNIPGCTYCH